MNVRASTDPNRIKAPPVLSVEGLTVVFRSIDGESRVVEDVSFSIQPGETLAVVGESGSGKSVTAKSIMRLIDFMGGEIVSGRMEMLSHEGKTLDLATLSGRALRQVRGKVVSLVFQEPMTSLNPVLTVGAQIGEAIRLHERCSKSEVRARTVTRSGKCAFLNRNDA